MLRRLEVLQVRLDETIARLLKALRRIPLFALLLDTFEDFGRDGMGMLAASLSYYALLTLFPLLLVLIAIASFFVSEADALGTVMSVVRDYLPGSEKTVQEILHQVVDLRGSATFIGFVTLAWSASGIFNVVQYALDRAWRAQQPRPVWAQRLISVAVLGALGLAFLASVFLSAFSEGVVAQLVGEAGTAREVVRALGNLLGIGLGFAAFGILYKTFPHAHVAWRDALTGAGVAALMWELAKNVYALYLVHFARFNLVYGSVGAIIGLLLWGYLSAMIVLFGAELAAAMGRRVKVKG